MNVEVEVLSRYSEGAKAKQAALCCPTSYDPALLALLPEEIIERDYGCGDPTPYMRPGHRDRHERRHAGPGAQVPG
jgi:arsenite methyltransferase